MNETPRILFVFPKCSGQRTFDGFDYHSGAACIRAFLAEHGVASRQFIHDGSATLEEIAQVILSAGAAIVGFSVYDISYPLVRMLARTLKTLSPETVIVCGGPSATFSGADILLDCEAVDICARGYAERTCLNLVDWFDGKKQLSDIPGIRFRREGRIACTDGALFNETDMESMPDPYLSGMLPPERCADIGITTSRGCSFPCAFCNCSAMSDRRVFYYHADRVMQVLEFLNERVAGGNGHKTLVPVVDDHFSINKKRFLLLVDQLGKKAFSNLEFWAEMRAENLEADTFHALAEAGFREIHFGLESAVPETLATLCKIRSTGWKTDNFALEREHLENIRHAIKSAKNAGLSVSVSVIFGAPGETEKTGLDTLRFIEQLEVDRYAHNYLRILPGTPLAQSCNLQGLQVHKNKHSLLPWKTTYAYDVFQLPVLHNDNAHFFRTAQDIDNVFRLVSGANVVTQTSLIQNTIFHNKRPLLCVADSVSGTDAFLQSARALPMNAAIWMKHNTVIERARLQAVLQGSGVPVHEISSIHVVEENRKTERWRINEISSSAPDENVFVIEPGSFVEESKQAHLDAKWAERRGKALSISSPRDLEALRALAENLRKKGDIKIGQFFGSCRTCVADECRWRAVPCPAERADRFFSTNHGTSPCFTATSPVAAEYQVESWKKLLREKAVEMETRRGCGKCPAHDRCARCIFTGTIPEQDYCAVQKSYPEAGALVGAMGALRALARDTGLAAHVPFAVLSLITDSDNMTLRRNDRLYSVSHGLAITFETAPAAFIFFPATDELFRMTNVERFIFLHSIQ